MDEETKRSTVFDPQQRCRLTMLRNGGVRVRLRRVINPRLFVFALFCLGWTVLFTYGAWWECSRITFLSDYRDHVKPIAVTGSFALIGAVLLICFLRSLIFSTVLTLDARGFRCTKGLGLLRWTRKIATDSIVEFGFEPHAYIGTEFSTRMPVFAAFTRAHPPAKTVWWGHDLPEEELAWVVSKLKEARQVLSRDNLVVHQGWNSP